MVEHDRPGVPQMAIPESDAVKVNAQQLTARRLVVGDTDACRESRCRVDVVACKAFC